MPGLFLYEDFESKNGPCQTTSYNIGKYKWKVLDEYAID